MDKNTLLARTFTDRMLALAASVVANHRITSRIDPYTGQAPLHRPSLDCLDGVHDACQGCACGCHRSRS